MKNEFKVLKNTRLNVIKTIKDLSLKQIHFIPKGFNNNIAWNITHLIATQQIICYKLGNQDFLVPDDLVENYKKGTSPKAFFSAKQWAEIVDLFLGLPQTLEEDYNEGIFTDFTNYTTSTGFEMTSIKEAISFNNYHEGLHFGSILALKRNILLQE